jgi:hypothetical protein
MTQGVRVGFKGTRVAVGIGLKVEVARGGRRVAVGVAVLTRLGVGVLVGTAVTVGEDVAVAVGMARRVGVEVAEQSGLGAASKAKKQRNRWRSPSIWVLPWVSVVER